MDSKYDRTKSSPYSTVVRVEKYSYYSRLSCKIMYEGVILPGEQWRDPKRAATVVDLLNEAYERGYVDCANKFVQAWKTGVDTPED